MKGTQDHPIHQSHLGLVQVDYGTGFTWAATVRGSAGHKQLERVANNEPRPSFEDEFDACVAELREPMRYFKDEHKEADEYLKHKRRIELIHEGDKMVRTLLAWWSPKKLDLVGAELSFRWQDPETRLWYAGTCDVISKNPLVLWDYKFGQSTPNSPSIYWGAQHHMYALAANKGEWTRKAKYHDGEHRLDFSDCDDWFTLGEWPAFFYVWMPGVLKRSKTSAERFANVMFPPPMLGSGLGLSVAVEGIRALTRIHLDNQERNNGDQSHSVEISPSDYL